VKCLNYRLGSRFCIILSDHETAKQACTCGIKRFGKLANFGVHLLHFCH